MSMEEANEENPAEAIWTSELNALSELQNLSSPIDLNAATMTVTKLKPLVWCNYRVPPKKLKLTNTGKTVVLSAKWHQDSPFLIHGPLLSRYVFSQIHFHWSGNDMNGSEHSVDGTSLPMELHAVHFKNDYHDQEAAMRKPDGITVIVYFFKSSDNPKINGIVKSLSLVQQAESSTRIVPWSITHLLRPFDNDYFFYRGSITSGNNASHIISWLISRQPIGISVEQLAEFQNLKDKNFDRLGRKLRILHEIGNRNVYHVNPSGSLYASLLPISRDDPPLDSMDTIDCCDKIVVDEDDPEEGNSEL